MTRWTLYALALSLAFDAAIAHTAGAHAASLLARVAQVLP
jgi:hypothetical protein